MLSRKSNCAWIQILSHLFKLSYCSSLLCCSLHKEGVAPGDEIFNEIFAYCWNGIVTGQMYLVPSCQSSEVMSTCHCRLIIDKILCWHILMALHNSLLRNQVCSENLVYLERYACFNAQKYVYAVVKVVMWSRGPHLTKLGSSKPHTHSTPN